MRRELGAGLHLGAKGVQGGNDGWYVTREQDHHVVVAAQRAVLLDGNESIVAPADQHGLSAR